MRKAFDYYCIGCILYEMLTGTKLNLSENELKSQKVFLPNFLSKSVKNLLEGLLCKDPDMRLGTHGIDLIKSHP